METVKLYTESRRILQPNVFRHCTDFTFPVSLLFLRLGPGGGGGGISHYDGSQPRSSAREVWHRFRHLSPLLGLNIAGCLAADEARLQGAFVWWEQKQTYTYQDAHNMLVNKRIRHMGDCFQSLGHLNWQTAFYMFYSGICRGCPHRQWNFRKQKIRMESKRRRCRIDFFSLFSTCLYEKVTLINAA